MDMKDKGAPAQGASESTSSFEEGADITPATGGTSIVPIGIILGDDPPPEPKDIVKVAKTIRKGERPLIYVKPNDSGDEHKPLMVSGLEANIRLHAYGRARELRVPIAPMRREHAEIVGRIARSAADVRQYIVPGAGGGGRDLEITMALPPREESAPSNVVDLKPPKFLERKPGDVKAIVPAKAPEIIMPDKASKLKAITAELKGVLVEIGVAEAAHMKEAAAKYLRAGRLLLQAKAALKVTSGGSWIDYLHARGLKERRAQNWMRLAKYATEGTAVAHIEEMEIQLGLKATTKALAKPRKSSSTSKPKPKKATTTVHVVTTPEDTSGETIQAAVTIIEPEPEPVEPTRQEPTPGFREATELLGRIEELAGFCGSNDPATVARGLMDEERTDAATWIDEIRDWLGLFLGYMHEGAR